MRKIFLYRCTSTFLAIKYCSGIFFKPLRSTKGAHNLFHRFLDFSQFFRAISRWRRHVAAKMRTIVVQYLKEQSILKKHWKPLQNRPINRHTILVRTVHHAQADQAWHTKNTNFYRQDAAKPQTASIKFTHRPKLKFFAPQGRLVASIHVKLGKTDGHVGPLGCAKFHLNRHRGWECSPEISKISTFWYCRGDSLDRFLNF